MILGTILTIGLAIILGALCIYMYKTNAIYDEFEYELIQLAGLKDDEYIEKVNELHKKYNIKVD